MVSDSEQTVIVNLGDLVPDDHILRKLKTMFPWDELARPFEKSFKGWKEYGPHGYPVSVLLKMTVLSHLYDLGDKETEIFVRENFPARYFIGMGLLQSVPDETTLCRFRGRIVKKNMDNELQLLFTKILHEAHRLGVEFGRVQIFDSVHTTSKASPYRTTNGNSEKTEKKGMEESEEGKKDGKPKPPPSDPDASWGCKGSFKVNDPETGGKKEQKKWFYGYKSHVSLNQSSRLVTSVILSTGKDYDSKASRFLLTDDMQKGLKPTVVTADKAYDDTEFYMFCGKHNIFNAVALKETRLKQKSKVLVKKWEEHQKAPFYKKALKMRYKIEAKFGEAKLKHGLGKSRYFGLQKFKFQSIFTFLCVNLKRIIKLIPKPKLLPKQEQFSYA